MFWHVAEGSTVSRTVTMNEQLAVAPLAALTWKVWVVAPKGKVVPDACPKVWAVVAPAQLSVPTGVVNETIAPQSPDGEKAVIFAGQVMIGNWASVTVTVNEQFAERLTASVTV